MSIVAIQGGKNSYIKGSLLRIGQFLLLNSLFFAACTSQSSVSNPAEKEVSGQKANASTESEDTSQKSEDKIIHLHLRLIRQQHVLPELKRC